MCILLLLSIDNLYIIVSDICKKASGNINALANTAT